MDRAAARAKKECISNKTNFYVTIYDVDESPLLAANRMTSAFTDCQTVVRKDSQRWPILRRREASNNTPWGPL